MEISYAKHQLAKSIAKVCLDVGWDRISQSALSFLIDLVATRITDIVGTASVYSTSAGRDSLGLEAICNALDVVGVDLAGLQEFCKYMPRVTPPCPEQFPRLRGVEVGHIDPGASDVQPGFIEVHHWLHNLKKMSTKENGLDLRRNGRIKELHRNLNVTNEDIIFKKPIGFAPRAKKSVHKPTK